MNASGRRPLTAEDLYNFQLVTDPQISPDGKHVLFGVMRVDEKTEKRYTNLWLAPADGAAPPWQFTYGDQTDTQARWSPDGTQIAFLSNRKDEKQMQLYRIRLGGGEARPLTNMAKRMRRPKSGNRMNKRRNWALFPVISPILITNWTAPATCRRKNGISGSLKRRAERGRS